jgi:molybdopterin-biosynthesis enzyme MoeA-like protein
MLSEEAGNAVRARAAADAERMRLIEKLSEPSGVSDDEAVKRVAAIVERAIGSGLREVRIYQFPNQLCTDRGRAISQNESQWSETLTGVPKEMYEFWNRALRPIGYKIRFEIVEWPGGMPGDIGVTLRWA